MSYHTRDGRPALSRVRIAVAVLRTTVAARVRVALSHPTFLCVCSAAAMAELDAQAASVAVAATGATCALALGAEARDGGAAALEGQAPPFEVAAAHARAPACESPQATALSCVSVRKAAALEDDDASDRDSLLQFIQTVAVEWPDELVQEWRHVPDSLLKIGERLGFSCQSCSSPRKDGAAPQ